MVPAALVVLDALPLTPNGKVDRKALPEPDRERPELREGYVAPRDEVEERLAGIWREILGVDRVGVRDSFFDLGGHSLLATQVLSRIRDAFQKEIPLREIFDQPTVAHLAGVLRASGGATGTTGTVEAPRLERAARERYRTRRTTLDESA
jgi:acyl carrier protein